MKFVCSPCSCVGSPWVSWMSGCTGQVGLTSYSILTVGVNVNLFLFVYMCQPLINCRLGHGASDWETVQEER